MCNLHCRCSGKRKNSDLLSAAMNLKCQYVIVLLLAILAAWYGYSHKELLLHVKTISVVSLTGLILAVFVSQIMIGYQFKCLMRIFGIDMDFREWFGLSACNSMFNYYLPARGGIAVRAYYLKKRYGFPYSHYTSLLAGSNIIAFILSAGMGLCLTLLYKLIHGIWHGKFLALFASLLLVTVIGTLVLLVFLKLGKTFNNARLNNILELFKDGLNLFVKNKKLVAAFSVFQILGIFAFGARLFICFSAIGVDVTPLQMLIIPSLTTFSLMLPLTPANLGIREGIISGCAYWFGLPADQALLAALIDRGAAVIMTFLFGLIFSRILLSGLKPAKEKPEKYATH
jgi:uncharacterized protein (TIRG00374 family)